MGTTGLEVADWRRRVSELYAAIRAQSNPERAHDLWRAGRDKLFLAHPQSPLPPADPLRSTGLPYWPYDPGLRFSLPVLPATVPGRLSLPAGETTYGGGRYLLDTAKGADLGGTADTLVIDLNFLYHPSCRYSSAWQCPLAPSGNTITAPIRAGERL